MTISVPGNLWSLAAGTARSAGARSQTGDDARLAATVALRRCAQFRKAFRCAAVSYPADVLRWEAPLAWIRRHGVAVDAADAAGLAAALSVGVLPQRIIAHGFTMPHGAGRFIVSSRQQVDDLAGAGPQRRRVLVDATDDDGRELAAAVVSGMGLDLIGVHRRLRSGEDGPAAVRDQIIAMRTLATRYNVIPARLSLGNVDSADWGCEPDDLAATAAAIDDAVEDGCVVSRFPSPAVHVAASMGALCPAA